MISRILVLLLCSFLAAGCSRTASAPPGVTPAPFTPIPSDDMAPGLTAPALRLPPSDIPPSDTTPPDPSPTWTLALPLVMTSVTPVPGQQWIAQAVLADGRCCVGGKVGETVQIPLALQASGPAGPATEMRYQAGAVAGCAADLSQAAWQPFAAQVTITTQIPTINWIGYWASVQFRDAGGNLSPIVCDDISMEGMPAAPSQSP